MHHYIQHNPPAPAIWAPRGRMLVDARPDQDSTPAVTRGPASDRSRVDARALDPEHPGDGACAAGRARLLPLPWPAARRRVTGVALAAAGCAATWAAVSASGPLSRGAAVQVLFAATMIACALGEILLSPAVPPVTGERARPGAAGRRNRLGTRALAAVCLLGPPAGGGHARRRLGHQPAYCPRSGLCRGRHRHPAF